ncbi:hypothetical protein QE450_004329 [Paenibacillus sp. SORGH_AS306]|uniref:barstar family protein n=1 Tax=unclassified Paenibacillus TaxID=185978 RepID=UPI002783871B|nr:MULTISPECIES: barstar family protein [unclassified Paenibacillus]MDQ1236831.1 hypothetical protein [Paenibacillus sp. SORGH_AS_0306]MDR6109192.1 hypothetical protein [Paenibacillus sp. SORGH_AS_0338]
MEDIYHVELTDMQKIKNTFAKNESLYIAEIDGKEIQSLTDYLTQMYDIFQFPIPSLGLDGYNDWMRDLDWLNKEGYVLIIYHFDDLLKQELLIKEQIINNFQDTILPFWRYEITTTVVGGKAKPFKIYFVN